MAQKKDDTQADQDTVEKQQKESPTKTVPTKEIGGREGPEPTRYGDWEKNGIISDF